MKKRVKPTGVSDAQARAIGHLTIKFNSLERAVEIFISLIISPREHGMDQPLLSSQPFSRKLDILKTLAESLSDKYAPTAENDRAYSSFLSATKDLISKARSLNTFRNSIIH